jgi:hypothetical protein
LKLEQILKIIARGSFGGGEVSIGSIVRGIV